MKNILHYIVYMVFLGGIFPFKLMPLGMVRAIGRFGGILWWLVDANGRRIVLKNLVIAFGKEKSAVQLKALRLDVFQNMAITFAEFLFAQRFDHTNIHKYMKIEGLENLNAAHKEKGAAIIATCHHANFTVLNWAAHFTGRPIVVILQKLKNPFVSRYFLDSVYFSGCIPLPPRGAVDQMLKYRDENVDYGFYADQRGHRVKGIYAPFFGAMCSNNPGLAVLARKHGIPVVPSEVIRTDYGVYGRFYPPFNIPRTDNLEDDLKKTVEMLNAHYEKVIRAHPEAYFWIHDRWRWTSPDDVDTTAPEYKKTR